MSNNLKPFLARLAAGETLTDADAEAAFDIIMSGEATPAQIGALLMAMRVRGETVPELTGAVRAMRARMSAITAPADAIDVVGTGGDGSGTFNISTAAAFVVASTGVPVAKHGNRAITSRSGSADVLEALGVRIDHTAESAADALREHGFAFLFAPAFHPAMKHAGPTRREIGIRTSFNLIGPLTNPAGARRALIGVGAPEAAARIAEVAGVLGTDRTLVVHGVGVDELPLDGSGVVYDVVDGRVDARQVDAASLGLAAAPTSALAGGTAAENAAIVEAVFAGEGGPRRDVVLLNAGAALVAAGTAGDIGEGIGIARTALDAGKPAELLRQLRAEKAAADAGAAAATAAATPA